MMNGPSRSIRQGYPSPLPSISSIAQKNVMEKNKKVVFWYGVVEIILGLISCATGIRLVTCEKHPVSRFLPWVDKIYNPVQFELGQGIWCGFFFIICGIFGVFIQLKNTRWLYLFNFVISILATIVMVILLVLSCISAYSAYTANNRFLAWYLILPLIGVSGAILAIMHAASSNVGLSNRRRPNGYGTYTSVQQQPIVPIQMLNSQIMYCPSEALCTVSPNFGSAHAQFPMLPMALTNANQLFIPAQPNFNHPPNSSRSNVSNPTMTVSSASPLTGNSISSQVETNLISQPKYVALPPAVPMTFSQQQTLITNRSHEVSYDRPPSYSEVDNDH